MKASLIGNMIRSALIGSTLGSTAAYYSMIQNTVATIKSSLYGANFSTLSNSVLYLTFVGVLILGEWGVTYFIVRKEYPSSETYKQGKQRR